ncbi:MAG: PKD domain-containing protein, partial [Methanomicrobiaceae archaeon]|nr:PKD domain-containing protein [Methanomicrobiaceae archaeon]
QPKAPVAGFVTDVAAGDAPLTVQFTDTSENNPTQWYWQFGDGATSTAQDPTHTYENAGSYTAALTVTNVDGTDTTTAAIEVTEPIVLPSSGDVLFIVGDASLKKGDRPIHDRLEALGLSVTVIDDDVCSATDAEGKDLIFVSSTVSSQKVGSKYRDLAIPFITHESYIFDDMKMTGTGLNRDYGSISGKNSVVIGEASHPLAAGLSGTVAVYTADEVVSFGNPPQSAIRVAWDPADSTRCVLFGYDDGAEMVGMTAPARRVGLFMTDSSSTLLTDEGWMLFDAAVAWAIEESQQAPPIAHFSSNPQTGDAPLEVQFTDASENNPTQWYWQFGDGTTATQQNPLHAYEGAGTYTVSL